MKNNTFFKLFIIIIFALILRLWLIEKPEGLWNDEYVSWYIASEKNLSQLIKDIFTNCHTPFYYFFLRVWMTLFGDSDLSLRISSVIPSVLSIPVIYNIGKKLMGKEEAYLCAFYTAISSFCIYFAQEVRLYSLLFLFSSLIIYYFVECINTPSKKSYILFFLFNALLCATHTLGIIYSFFSISTLFYCIFKNNDSFQIKINLFYTAIKYFLPFLVVVIILTPLLFTVATSQSLSQFWSDFSYSKIIYTFTDYYSPVQTNISNSPNSILPYIFNDNKIRYSFIIFGIIPLIIGLFSLVSAIRQKNTVLNYILCFSFIYFLVLIIIAMSGKMVLSTKYSIEIYPALIIAISCGIFAIKRKILKISILLIFISLHLFYILFSPEAAQRITRDEGHLAPVKLIEYSRLKDGDKIILTYYGIDKFERYLPDKNKYDFYSINKFNFNYPMFNNDNYFEVIHHGKDIYKDYFKEFPNEIIIKYSRDNFINKMNKGDRIGLVTLDNVSFLTTENIIDIASNDSEYKRTPFIFLAFSALKNNLMYSFKDEYKIDSITQSGKWTLYVYEKTH